MVRTGDSTPINIKLADGKVLRFSCTALPDGGRMLSYTPVTDLVRHGDDPANAEYYRSLRGRRHRTGPAPARGGIDCSKRSARIDSGTPVLRSGPHLRAKLQARLELPFPCVIAESQMSLTIRSVTHQDYDQWLPLWDGYNAFYGRSGATALAPEITAMTWPRFFDAYEPVHGLVAEHDGKLLGLTNYLFHRSTTSIEPTCYLHDLHR